MSTPGGPYETGSGDAGRWAPFPVQDWSRMPPAPSDPYANVDPASPPGYVDPTSPPGYVDPTSPPGYVDPTWGPPAGPRSTGPTPPDRRPGWLPLLAVVLVTVLVAGGLLVTSRAGRAAARTAADTYVPADGSVAHLERTTSIGQESTSSAHVVESARQHGALVLSGLDFTLGSKVLGAVGGIDHLDEMAFWRTTGTMIGNLGNSQQHVRVYRVDGPVELVAESGDGGADVYTPALLELPAEVQAGDTWASEGTIGSRHYRSDLRAAAAEPGCLQVTGTIVESTAAGQAGTTREVARTWCDGRGVTVEETVRGDVVTRVQSGPRPATDPTLRTVAEKWAWGDPATWRRRDYDLLSVDLSLGTGSMTGAPSQVPPVITASGLVFRTTNGDDLVAT
ncbi:MAG TPA: hypothetical protein VFU98_14985, partial [Microlunatus sp.]|nr:hypothetical protein [Microlunatus sp.]